MFLLFVYLFLRNYATIMSVLVVQKLATISKLYNE